MSKLRPRGKAELGTTQLGKRTAGISMEIAWGTALAPLQYNDPPILQIPQGSSVQFSIKCLLWVMYSHCGRRRRCRVAHGPCTDAISGWCLVTKGLSSPQGWGVLGKQLNRCLQKPAASASASAAGCGEGWVDEGAHGSRVK